jgi:hypothetical protein
MWTSGSTPVTSKQFAEDYKQLMQRRPGAVMFCFPRYGTRRKTRSGGTDARSSHRAVAAGALLVGAALLATIPRRKEMSSAWFRRGRDRGVPPGCLR